MPMFCRYFRLYLKKVAPTQDLEISVQCDVAVFSWLLQYTKAAAARRQPPVLTVSNCMPVLIASHFLQVSHQISLLPKLYTGSGLAAIAQGAAAAHQTWVFMTCWQRDWYWLLPRTLSDRTTHACRWRSWLRQLCSLWHSSSSWWPRSPATCLAWQRSCCHAWPRQAPAAQAASHCCSPWSVSSLADVFGPRQTTALHAVACHLVHSAALQRPAACL